MRYVGQPALPPTWIAVDDGTCRLQDGPSRPRPPSPARWLSPAHPHIGW